MNLWIKPITDRTEADVKKASEMATTGWDNLTDFEKEEWKAGLKGTLNNSDLLRIETDIKILADVLELPLTTYADGIPEFLSESYFDNLLSNIRAIRQASAIHSDTPKVPESPANDYEKINDIEKILSDIYEILMNNFHYYTGNEIYAGDVFGLLL